MKHSEININDLEMCIGLSEELTDDALRKIKTIEYNTALLPLYNLLLLEKYDETILLIKEAMDKELDITYVNSLQKSRFWLQRKSIPEITMNFPNKLRKELLKTCLKDDSHIVVRESINSMLLQNPFSKDETEEIVNMLFDSPISNNRIAAVEIMTLFNFESRFLEEVLKKNCWRTRLSCAKSLRKFPLEKQKLIISELKNDKVDEVRIELVKKLDSLEYIGYLNDSNVYVRSEYLSNVINQVNDDKLLKDIITNNDWEVGKVLLNMKGDFFKQITIPLIENNIKLVSWRTRLEILDLLKNQIKDEIIAKMLIDFFINCVKDKVFIIRKKVAEIFVELIDLYDWMINYEDAFIEILKSTNYLHRLTFIPVIIKFDLKFHKKLSEIIENDKVKNVKNYFKEVLTRSINT